MAFVGSLFGHVAVLALWPDNVLVGGRRRASGGPHLRSVGRALTDCLPAAVIGLAGMTWVALGFFTTRGCEDLAMVAACDSQECH
jgi:hypothetical protein